MEKGVWALVATIWRRASSCPDIHPSNCGSCDALSRAPWEAMQETPAVASVETKEGIWWLRWHFRIMPLQIVHWSISSQNKSRTLMKIQIMLSTWDNGNSLIIEIVNYMSVDTTWCLTIDRHDLHSTQCDVSWLTGMISTPHNVMSHDWPAWSPLHTMWCLMIDRHDLHSTQCDVSWLTVMISTHEEADSLIPLHANSISLFD